jgi:hypothetical protein
MGLASRFACAGRRRWIFDFKQPGQVTDCSVIASAAKQSIVPQLTKLDCFAALAMTDIGDARTNRDYGFRARCCASPRDDSRVGAGPIRRVARLRETLFDDFRVNALWLWVPHRASLVRDDGGDFSRFKQPGQVEICSVIASAAKQSIAPQLTKLDCFAALAMTAGDGTQALHVVIPRCAIAHRGCALAQARNP